ncbi:PKD-like domain-containing protein [Aquimarina sp. 2201CG1-2-11]|uniref:PKD-like domain-containing protein n=1 Tax=Aquimarina discodermiae TaxID=3231043 RepID=UPI003461AC1D
MAKLYILIIALIIGGANVRGQLSNIHYLPPLKQGNGGSGSISQQRIYLSTPETTAFDVQIYNGTNPTAIATITGLSNTSSQTYNLANGNNGLTLVSTANTGIVLSNAGLRFESAGGEEFYVNYRGRSNAQAASLTSKGRQAFGTSFKWGGRPNYGNSHNTLNAVVGIMATQDNTTVNIFGYDSDCTFRNGNSAAGITADNITITLNAGQSYVLEAPRNNGAANIDCWLGASIQSNKNIVISNGNLNGAPSPTSNSRDAGIDQAVPENVLGREYVFVRAGGTDLNETPIIIGTQNGTDIFVNGATTPIATINDGDYFMIPGTNYSSGSMGANMYVTASKEVYAYQNIAGSSAIQTGGLNFIAPTNCLLPDFFDNLPDIRNVAGLNFTGGVTITASTSTPDANITVTDDNGAVTLPASIPVTGSSDWKTITALGLTGDVSVQSTGPIAVGFFGASGNAGLAGYYSGFDTVPVVELDVTGDGCLPGSDVFEVSGNFDAYQWFENGALIPGETTSVYTPSEPGDFFVRVTRGPCTYDSAILSVFNCDPEIVLTKTVDNTTAIEGDTVTFTIEVEQLGINPVTNLVINDLLPPELTFGTVTPSYGTWSAPNWTIGDMFSGEVHTLTIEAIVNEVATPGVVTNTISNTQTEVEGNFLPDDPTEDVTIINNELTSTKTDRPAPDGSYDTVGETITYDFVVTNTGDQIIPSVTISDPDIDPGSLSPASVSNLAIGGSATFTATHTITQEDIEAGQVINSATAEGTLSNGFVISDISDDPDDPTTSTHDPTITPIEQIGALILEKIAQPSTGGDGDSLYNQLGEIITYELTVYNTGNVSLNNITITDSNADLGSISPAFITNLPVGASAVFTAQHTIVSADFTAGNVTNIATVSGTEVVEGTLITDTSDDPTTIVLDDATVVTIPQIGRIEVTKAASPPADGDFDTVGETITYTLVATNTGTVALTDINLVDPNADTLILDSTTGTDDGLDLIVDNLAPLETATFTATHIITQDDLDTGEVINTATAGAQYFGGSITDISDDPNDSTTTTEDPTIVAMTSTPSMTVTKTADDDSNVSEGQIIIYTYVVTNTGNVTIDEVTINDVHSGNGVINTPSLQSTTGTDDTLDNDVDSLAPGQIATWTLEYIVTSADITDQVDITNTVTATGTPKTGSITDPVVAEIVTVNPIETICGGVTLSHDLTNDVDTSIVSFSWSATDNPLLFGETTTTNTSSEITDTLVNGVTSAQDIIYTITGFDSGGVIQDVYTYTVTVQPIPTVTGSINKTKNTCSETSLNEKLINDIDNYNDGVTFSWLAAENPNVTGETTTSNTAANITDTLINTTTTPQDVVYTITPSDSTTGCIGTIYTITITVNPKPSVITSPTDTICSDVSLNHDLNSDIDLASGTFSWSAAENSNVTGETTAASTDNSITDTLTNISGTVQIVTYTITPTSVDGCEGDSYTYVVTVNPEPFVTTPPSDTICNDETLNHNLNNDIDLIGVSFSWSAADNPDVTGETIITSTDIDITDTLTNTSGTIQTVTYTITPTSADGCQGDSYTYVVTINPEPSVSSLPTDTVCSDISLNHDLNNDVNLTGVTFSWLAADNPDVTGETITTSTDTNITDILTNISGTIQTVTYTITPTSANGCEGDSYTYVVTINPEPFVAAPPFDVACSNIALDHDLTEDVNLPGTTFSWFATDNPNITGETTTSSTDSNITDTLSNTSDTTQMVIYTITPTSSDGCEGDAYNLTLFINPEPFVTIPPIEEICSDEALNHDLSNDVNLTGVIFLWVAIDNPNVTGETITTTNTSSITDTLINTSGVVQDVIYTVLPVSASGCVGSPFVYSYTVRVSPKAFVNTPPTDVICTGTTLNHDLIADINIPGTTFSWSAAENPDVTGETTTTSTATSITDTLTSTSGTPQIVTYTIIPTTADGCEGDTYTYEVTVNPKPVIITPPIDTICSDATLNHNLNDDVDLTGVTFSWSAAENPDVTGETTSTSTATSITDTLTNTSGTVQTITYTITPTSADGCEGDSYTHVVTINPEPFVVTSPTDTICSDATLNHDLNNDVDLTGVSFSWSAVENPDVTGETTVTITDTSITDTLTNTSGTVQTVTYTITPTSADGCEGDSYTYVVTINPEPFVVTPPTDTICSDVALNHDLNNDVDLTGVSFSWSAAENPNVTGETTTTSTASSITDTLTNISGSVQTVTYTITPTSANGCQGDSYTYVVTINPEPFVVTPPIDTICSDATLNHNLNDDVNLTGVTFSWAAVENPNVTGETTTTSTSTSITDTLTNISRTVQIVTYIITPTSADGCQGDSYTYVVTINPEPFVVTPPTDTICSEAALNHNLNDDVDLTGGTFSWTAAENPNVTGETTTTSTATSITDTLTNTSGTIQTVTYTITPTSANGCEGDSYTYVVTINPEPFVVTPPTDTICSDVALNHDLNNDVDLTGVSFSWAAAENPNVTGETTTTSTATSITDILTNISGTVQTVIYTIIPTSADGCQGDSYTYVVTINPEPFVVTPPTDTICSDTTLNHNLNNDVNLIGVTFSWAAAENPDVTGETTTISTASSITDTLTNISGSVQTVTYTITPTSADGCQGDSYTYVVTINPEPIVITPPTDTICSGTTLNHNLNNDVNLTGTSFSWSAVENPNVAGETTTTSNSTSITDTLINISGTVQTVIYSITPTSADGCQGDSYTYVVTVNPEPFVVTPPTDTICSDVTLNHNLNDDVDLTGGTFSWAAAENPNVTGETTTISTATSITDTLTNASGTIQTVTYTITPTSADGCQGSFYTYVVTINPEPFVVTPPTDTICSDVALNHNLNNDVDLTGGTFSWAAAENPNVTGETATISTATSITDTLTNTSGTVQTVTYTITPTSSDGCQGDSYTYVVTINPEPFVLTPPTDTICSDVALNHNLNNDVDLTVGTFSWSAAENPNVAGETTTTSNSTSITDTLINISGTVQTVIYTITPTSADGCQGDSYTYVVTVNPEPFVVTPPIDTICSDVTLNHNLNDDVDLTGVTFSWAAAENPDVTGETTTTSTATSITDTLTNASGTIQTVTYTITPTSADGCQGSSYTYVVTINPEPFVVTPPTDTICSDATLNHNLNNDVDLTGVTFSWAAVENPNVTGETTTTSVNGIITDTLINTSTVTQTVTYTITPTSTGSCVGDSYNYVVTINPKPYVASPPTDIICSDVMLNHNLNNDVNLTGVTFSWAAAENPNVTGETITTSTSTSITNTLTNASGTIQTVTYTITPTSADGCQGDSYTYVVTINPEPFVVTPPTDTICSDTTLNHNLNNDVNLTGVTFSWVAAENPNITGETTTISTATSITDTLTNISGIVQTVTYTITPTSADGCQGDSYTYVVTINPEPIVITPPTDTICSGTTLNHNLNNDVNLTGTSFSWSAVENSNVTGETTTTSTSTSITDTLTNASGTIQTVTYTITPTSADGCQGDSYTYVVTINPEPFNVTPPTDTICSDTTLNHNLNDDVDLTGVTFSWAAAENPNVTGETTATSTATSITDTLTNDSGTVQTITYTITPTSTDGCQGDSYTYVVTINPEPFVATPPTDIFCSDTTLNHNLNDDVNLTGVIFSWVAAENPNITGETTTISTVTSITDTLINTSTTTQTVIYTITPTSADGCIGNSYTYTITISPKPLVITSPTDIICSDTALNHNLNNDVNLTGVTFSWVAAENPNVTGETTATSTTTSITDSLTNTSGIVQTVTYTITPTSADGCEGNSYTYVVTINPEPFVATPPTDTICSDVTLNHNLNNDVNLTGVTFSWAATENPNIIGETTATSTTDTITDTLINTSGATQIVTYTITPTGSNGCVGDSYTYTVTINPKPFVTSPPSITVCNNVALSHDLTNDVNLSGVSFSWFAMDNVNVTGETTTITTTSNITDTLINNSPSVETITYTITPISADGCSGNPYTLTVLVTPTPELIVTKEALPAPDGSYDTVGESINYQIIIRNSKSVDINNVTITDNNADYISMTNIPTIHANTSITITARHTITQEDLNNGTVTNVVTVEGTDTCNTIVTDISDDPNTSIPNDPTVVTLDQNPALQLLKTADIAPDGAWDEVNEVITYALVVTNTGNIPLQNVIITDANADSGSLIPSFIATIQPGDQINITAAHTITQSDLDHGSVTNSAYVDAEDLIGNIITDISDDPNDNTNIDLNADGIPDDPTVVSTIQSTMLEVTKIVDKKIYSQIGDILSYTILITNTSNITLHDVIVNDPNISFTSPNTLLEIAPNESFTVTGYHIIDKQDITNEMVSNTAIVKALFPNGTAIIFEDSDDPNDRTDIDIDNDEDPEDPTVSYYDKDEDNIPNIEDFDDDNDGITDIEEQNGDLFLDTDDDGIIDRLDLDSDGDGIYDFVEAGHNAIDSEIDGTIDGPYGSDGISDSVQDNPYSGEVNYQIQDTDNDSKHDFQDIDDDDDGLLTENENPDPNGNGIPEDAFDTDADGTPDYLDPNLFDPNAEDDVEIYNVVTPNGDGDHDMLLIRNIQNFPENEIKIFNRWGVLVYEVQGYGKNNNFFRGQSMGRVTLNKEKQLPVGTYFYILTYTTKDGKTKKRSDYLYINR